MYMDNINIFVKNKKELESLKQTITIFGQYIGIGGARGVMVIVVGTEHGDTSSNLGRD